MSELIYNIIKDTCRVVNNEFKERDNKIVIEYLFSNECKVDEWGYRSIDNIVDYTGVDRDCVYEILIDLENKEYIWDSKPDGYLRFQGIRLNI